MQRALGSCQAGTADSRFAVPGLNYWFCFVFLVSWLWHYSPFWSYLILSDSPIGLAEPDRPGSRAGEGHEAAEQAEEVEVGVMG